MCSSVRRTLYEGEPAGYVGSCLTVWIARSSVERKASARTGSSSSGEEKEREDGRRRTWFA